MPGVCPACGGATKCVFTRQAPEETRLRRYVCSKCDGKYTTLEMVIYSGEENLAGKALGLALRSATNDQLIKELRLRLP